MLSCIHGLRKYCEAPGDVFKCMQVMFVTLKRDILYKEKVTTNLMPLKQDNYWASRPISPSRNLTIFAFSTRRRASF